MIDPEVWFLFPLGIGIAILAISSGINGSNFWIPVYVVWLGFDAKTAFWLGLVTMMFGFGSGVWKNFRANLIHWFLVRQYLKICIPLSVGGGILSSHVSHSLVLSMFGVFITAFGCYRILQQVGLRGAPPIPHTRVYWSVGAIGGVLIGFITTGLGKLLRPCLMNHRQIHHHAEAVGTTVTITFIVSFFALCSRMDTALVEALVRDQAVLISTMFFVVPGVVLGGYLGPLVAQKLERAHLEMYAGVLMVLVGGMILLHIIT